MSLRTTKEHIKIQILETERLAEGVADHPVMSYSFQKRLEELRSRLASLEHAQGANAYNSVSDTKANKEDR